MIDFKTTEEIQVPTKIIDCLIGQDKAVKIVKKAAKQRRHILLMGVPGTGKSMLAQAMAEIMPTIDLEDVLAYPNRNEENNPIIKKVKTYPTKNEIEQNPQLKLLYLMKVDNKWGQGRRIKRFAKMSGEAIQPRKVDPLMVTFLVAIVALIVLFLWNVNVAEKWLVLGAIGIVTLTYFLFTFLNNFSSKMGINLNNNLAPKLLIDNTNKNISPFIDATGAKAGALLGDVKHDPLQSGGLGTPAHLRVEAGAIHKAHRGVLFIDEIASLKVHFQQEILTAMQEKKYTITGQSENSSGAIVKTEAAPCDFVLVAAGNFMDLGKMHPALRSRIRGAGYEIRVEDHMPDTPENRNKLVYFVAQEVNKDKKIPHFTRNAVLEVIEESRRRSRKKNSISLNLRELGGVIRAAGDIAEQLNAKYVTEQHVLEAIGLSGTLEQQIAKEMVKRRKEYQVFKLQGYSEGRVNGLAVLGDPRSGIVLPIEAQITPAASNSEGKLIATGKLGEIAKEAVSNVSAIIKKHAGKDFSRKDIHIQFLQSYEGVEGDSASISIAIAIISAMVNIPINQSLAMTGSLSIRGEVLPVGGVTGKVMAAIDSGMTTVMVPEGNVADIYLPKNYEGKIKIIPAQTVVDVLEGALKDCPAKKKLIKQFVTIRKEFEARMKSTKTNQNKKITNKTTTSKTNNKTTKTKSSKTTKNKITTTNKTIKKNKTAKRGKK